MVRSVGIRTALDLLRGARSLPLSVPEPRRMGVRSPWTEGQLEQIVWSDIYGDPEVLPVTRAEAMKVPSVAKARWLICTQLGGHPLASFTGDTRDEPQPAWLHRTNGITSPQMRMTWTLDDLLFTGYSLWAVHRGAGGQILDATRVPLDWWRFDEEYRVLVRDQPVRADEVLLFTSPHDPLLTIAADTIRAARNVERAWAAKVKDPTPTTIIEQTEDIELEDEYETDEDGHPLLDPEGNPIPADPLQEGYDIATAYVKQRRGPNGAVVVVPYGWRVRGEGTTDPALYIEGRNAIALDVARYTGLPASILDAAQVQASLKYENTEGRQSEVDASLAGWALPIESRLSLDDCVPAGHSVRFDPAVATAVTGAAGPARED